MKKMFYMLSVFVLMLTLFISGCSVDSIQQSQTENSTVKTTIQDDEEVGPFSSYPVESIKEGYYHGKLITYVVKKGYCIYEDCIIIDPSEIQDTLTRGTGISDSDYYWPNKTIYYRFDSSFVNNVNTSRTENAIEYYQSLGFNMVERTTQSNYIDFIYIDEDSGMYSNSIGMKGGRQIIHLYKPYGYGNAVHEIGHAIGFYHEQSRADRDDYINIDWSNIKSGKSGNFNRVASSLTYHTFDWSSIMLYGSYAFAANSSKPTITRKDGSTWNQQRNGFSKNDLDMLFTMYPSNRIKSTDVVSRDSKKIDIVKVDGNGAIKTAASNEDNQNGTWRGWWSIANGVTADSGNVSIVSRDAKKLDAFTVGTNARVYAAAWDSDIDGGNGFRGWWTVGSLTCPKSETIAAVSRAAGNLDLFAVGVDGGIYTAAWQQNIDGANGFRGWWRVSNGSALSGTDLTAVTRVSNSLDLFTIGLDSNVYYTNWTSSLNNGNWRVWSSLGSCNGMGVTTIKAVASSATRLHVYAVRLDGQIYSNELDTSISAQWTGWRRLGTIVATAGTKVAAVSRKTGFVDVFVLGSDQHVYTAAWETLRDQRNTYRGWWDIGLGFTASTNVSAVAKDANTLDVFGIKANGLDVYCKTWSAASSWSAWVRLP